MATTVQDLARWLKELYDNPNYTHMIVVCDTFDYGDYPVYVTTDQNVRKVEAEYSSQQRMSKVMEVYSRKLPMSEQLGEIRAFNYD